MNWPAHSFDGNPVERAWNTLGRRVAARLSSLAIRELLIVFRELSCVGKAHTRY